VDDATLIMMLVGVTVMMLVGGLMMLVGRSPNAAAEERLKSVVAGRGRAQATRSAQSLLKAPSLDPQQLSAFNGIIPNIEGLRQLYEQADIDLEFRRFLMIMPVLGIVGGLAGLFTLPILLVPVAAGAAAGLPVLFLIQRKNKRIQTFMASMPEAVELMSRALRAGHGLAAGMQLVSQELKGPISEEFGRVFEEQNLGVPIDVALRGLAERVPTMDVRFLVTAIVIQRTTGGDLAEVLDKIGRLIRQRFELAGHVKSLTAEGRLSGIVLLAMPPGLLAFLMTTNYSYVAPLFETPGGTKMLAITAVLQVLGALAIKKIVAIKV